MTTLEHIKAAVEKSAGVLAKHVETVGVVETFRGQVVWKGAVEVYDIAGLTMYGRAVVGENGSEPQYVPVQGQPPVKNAVDAVRVWIASQARK